MLTVTCQQSDGFQRRRETKRIKMLPLFLVKLVFSVMSYTSFQTLAQTFKTHCGDVESSFGLSTKCIKDLGCFSNRRPFHHLLHRPISLLPEDGIRPKFMLYKRPNTENYVYLEDNEASLRNSKFDPSLKTIVIVHGFRVKLSEVQSHFMIKDMLLKHWDVNVIFVDWTDFNGPFYPQAIANGRVVGAWLAKLLQFLHKRALISLKSVHLIGHSLGAHVCGWAGERLKDLYRITGLDPAGPFFYHAPNCVKLDETDAEFVDVICTNGGSNSITGMGLSEPIGHVNFFPNGGCLQPGCVPDNDIAKNEQRIDSCSHERSVYFFVESIDNGSCVFEGVPCDSWERFGAGKFGGRPIAMGFNATKPESDTNTKTFFLKTRGSSPFCKKD